MQIAVRTVIAGKHELVKPLTRGSIPAPRLELTRTRRWIRSCVVPAAVLLVLSAGQGCNLLAGLDDVKFEAGSGLGGAAGMLTTSMSESGGMGGAPSTTGGMDTATSGGGGMNGTTSSSGGTGGITSTTSGNTGGTGGAGPAPTSCAEALSAGMSTSGTVMVDLDGAGPDAPVTVYCDQENDGGGWALVYNSVGDPNGTTTAFWNIPYAERFGTKGSPGLAGNYYCGRLYLYGLEYRDDAADVVGNEARGILRATAAGINQQTMKFMSATDAGSLDVDIFADHFQSGWSSPDMDNDPDAANCAVQWLDVTQHYKACWKYNLGADGDPGATSDFTDGGWGPHILNSTITKINVSGPVQLQTDGMGGAASRMSRISRFTRW